VSKSRENQRDRNRERGWGGQKKYNDMLTVCGL